MFKMLAESFSGESEEWEGTKGDRMQITKTGVAGKANWPPRRPVSLTASVEGEGVPSD